MTAGARTRFEDRLAVFAAAAAEALACYQRCHTFSQRLANGEIDDPCSFGAEERALAEAMDALDRAAGTSLDAVVETDRGPGVVRRTDINGVLVELEDGLRRRFHRAEIVPSSRCRAAPPPATGASVATSAEPD